MSFQASAATWVKDTGWELKPASDGVYQVLPGTPSGNKPTGVTCVGGSCTATKPTPIPKVTPPANFNPSTGFSKAAIAIGLASRLGPWISVGTAAYNWLKDSNLTPDANTGEITENLTEQAVAPSTVFQPQGNPCFQALGLYASRDSALVAGSQNYLRCMGFTNTATKTWELLSNATWTGSTIVQGYVCLTDNGVRNCTYRTNVGFGTFSNSSSNCYLTATGQLTGLNTTGGSCPSGSPTPVAASAVAPKLTGPISDPNLAKVWREVLDNGGQIEDTGVPSLTGPTQVTGPTTSSTSTTANGTSAVTNTTINYNINYNSNTLTINESKTVANPDGSTSTTTQKPAEPCAADPLSLACAKLGDPGTDNPKWETKTVTFQAENLGFGGSCPAPWTAIVRGWQLSMSYQPACDVAPQVRLGLLALSTLGALLMIVNAVKS